jgi:hypothetical protein
MPASGNPDRPVIFQNHYMTNAVIFPLANDRDGHYVLPHGARHMSRPATIPEGRT